MANQCIAQTASAYGFPLLIKGLLESGVTRAPEQEIVSADSTRLTYWEFAERVGRLASGLASLGVEPGDTVAIMDWDTNRYLECYFAVPMMGAVLHTVNVRLSAEQILYTINHAEDDVILINSELLPLLEQIWDRVDAGKKLVLLNDTGGEIQTVKSSLSFDAEYEALLAAANPRRDFPDLDENTRATTFYTTGTTGPPKGVYFSHRQLVLHTLSDRAGIAAIGHGGNFVPNRDLGCYFFGETRNRLWNGTTIARSGAACFLTPRWNLALLLAQVVTEERLEP